jgi:hypothetical protein
MLHKMFAIYARNQENKEMRLLLAMILISASTANAKPKKIMECLGAEEFKYHKNKVTGPLYKLNNVMISYFLQFPSIVELRPKYYQRVCNKKDESPALGLLKEAYQHRDKIFRITNLKDDQDVLIAKNQISQFTQALPTLVLNLIRDVQAQAPSAGCIEKHVPGLRDFFYEIKYLQEEINPQQLFDKRQEIVLFFNSLPKLNDYYEKCWKEKKELEKNRNSKASSQ